MKISIVILIFFPSFIVSCGQSIDSFDNAKKEAEGKPILTIQPQAIINKASNTIETRFFPPSGYERVKVNSNSFAEFLRHLELKPFGSQVLYYDKTPKTQQNVYISVINMDIGNKDLQQCADAVMRLRGEYLFKQKKYQEIHFNFLSDGKPRYFQQYANGDYSYKKFRKYMDYIFSYANTSSLYDELSPVDNIQTMQIGDVFIQKGKPYGHAVIVVDMAVDKDTGEKLYLLAQSYMPAQETQILINPMNEEISPWYEQNDEKTIYTPEWTFEVNDLRRFIE